MKITIILKLLLAFSSVTFLFTNSQDNVDNSGFVGDVRYSVLAPDKFIPKHPGWILMDGKSIDGTSLANDYGVVNIPDARGVFIRGMNMDRSSNEGDVEGNRPMGKPQNDNLIKHQHFIPIETSASRLYQGDGRQAGNTVAYPQINNQGFLSAIQNETPGSETRPRNIPLYTYIKIN